MKTLLLEEMAWPEIKEALDGGVRTVIICAASVEQHGPHLAEITDTILGYAAAEDLAKRLGNALVAPVIRPGLSAHHMPLAGSVTLRPETFTGIVEDYISSYIKHGFDTIILCSSHGGNFKTLEQIAASESLKYPAVNIVTGYSLDELTAALEELEAQTALPPGSCGGHSCAWETSVMLKFAPNYVDMNRAQPGFVGRVSPEVLETFFTKGVTAVSANGVLGNPVPATPEMGDLFFNTLQDIQERVVREKLAQKKR